MIKVWVYRQAEFARDSDPTNPLKRIVEATTTGPSLTVGLWPDIKVGDRLVMMSRDNVVSPEGWVSIGVGAWERIVTVDEPMEVELTLKAKPTAVALDRQAEFFKCPECGQLIGLTLKGNLRVHTFGQLEERCSGSGFPKVTGGADE